jgi:acetone monooxygenase
VFQRTPQYAIPMRNYRHTSAEHLAFRARYPEIRTLVHTTFAGFDYDFTNGVFADHSPKERRKILEKLWAEGTLNFWIGSFPELFTDPKVNEEMSEFVRDKIRKRINDPKVAEKLVPTTYGFGTHRVPLETKYFEAYNRPNVELIDAKANPIVGMTEKGAKTADGVVHELDYLILATGFDAGTGALTRIDVRGRGGRSLREDWGRDIRTTMGLQVHGYPNLFTTGAPLAPAAAFCNMTTCLQQQVDWITDCIKHLRERGLSEIEPTEQTQDQWVVHHDEIANATLVTKTDSWYMGSNVKGKPRRLLSYIGGVGNYKKACDDLKASGYVGFAMR